MWHPEEPPPTSFRNPKKYVGGVYFTWSGEIRRPRQTQGGARQGIILLTLVSDYYRSRRSSSRRSKAKTSKFSRTSSRSSSSISRRQHQHQHHHQQQQQPSRISEGTFRPPGSLLLRMISRHFWHEIRWCFAVSSGFRKRCLAVGFLPWRLVHGTAGAAASADASTSITTTRSSSSRCSCNTAAGTARAAAAGTGGPAATSSSSMADQQKSNPPTLADARGSAPGTKTSKFSRTSSKSSGSGSSSGSSESSTSSKSSGTS